MRQMTFGEIIKKEREQRKISQEILAENIREAYNVRISTSYLSMIETNTRTNLTVKLINALLQHLDLPFEAVFSLFASSRQSAQYGSFSHAHIGVRETPSQYTAIKNKEIGGELPPEAQKPLNEIYALLVNQYAKNKEN